MKKYLAILMAVILVMAFTVGCAPEETPQEETPIEDMAPETPDEMDDMEDPGEIEGPGDENGGPGNGNGPSGNDEDLDNPTDTEGTPSGSIKKLNYLS